MDIILDSWTLLCFVGANILTLLLGIVYFIIEGSKSKRDLSGHGESKTVTTGLGGRNVH